MTDRWVERAGRLGLLSRAAIWLVTSALAARLAFEGAPKPGAEPDKNGALHTLARQRLGSVLLLVLLAGFVAMVAWSVIEAVREEDGERGGHWGHRLVAAGRALVYAALAVTTVPLVFGDNGSDGSGQERVTARVLGWPGGRLIVGAVAAALVAAAAYNVYRGVTRRYEKHWDRSRMDGRAKRIAAPIEIAGNLGHATVFALVGWFLLMAAWRYDATEPKSLDESLAALVQQSNGRPLCLLVAAGMAAWGLNAAAQSRWREVPSKE